MIKVMLKSKYIKLTILITCIVIIMICFLGIRFGNEMISDEVVYGTVEWSKNGDYLLSNKDGAYIVTARTDAEKVIYTARSKDASFADIEGYIIDKNESGKKVVVDFLTGEMVFVPKGDDNIVTNVGKIWLIESMVEGDGLLSTTVYYVLDENFDVALNGRIFNSVHHTDKYLYGQLLTNENYYNMQEISKYEVFGPSPDMEYTVVDGNGDIVYVSEEFIHGMVDDCVVIQREDRKYVYVDIFTGEKEVVGYEYD